MRKLLLLTLLAAPLFAQTANTTIQPDCLIPFTLTAAGNAPVATVAGAPNDNRTKGCAAWTLMYQSTDLVMVTVTLQSASTTGTSPSYGSFAGTISTGFANPIVSDTGGSVQAVNGTADISWVRVNVAATGSGTLTGVLYGFRNSSAAVNSGGGGGVCPNGAANDIQVTDGTNCVGSADFTRDLVTGEVDIIAHGNNAIGLYGRALVASDGGSPIGLDAGADANGFAANDLYGLFVDSASLSGGSAVNNYGIFVDDQTGATNNWAIKTGLGLVQFGDESLLDPFLQGNVPADHLLIASLQTGALNPAAVSIEAQGSGYTGVYAVVLGVGDGSKPTGFTAAAFGLGNDWSIGFESNSGYNRPSAVTPYGVGFYATAPNINATGVITNAIGFYMAGMSNGSDGPATNQYGIKVEDITGATTNHAIQTGLGQVAFGGNPITPFQGLYVGPDESTLPATIQQYESGNVLITGLSDALNFSGLSLEVAGGNGPIGLFAVGYATGVGTAGGIEGDAYAGVGGAGAQGGHFFAGSDGVGASALVGVFIESAQVGGGSAGVNIGLQIQDQTAGVSNWAINTGLGLNQLGDVLYLAGNVVNPFQQIKNTQTATAPGATKCDLRWIAGTIGSSGKIVAACGTSATEVTIADNVGTGF